MKLGTWSQVLDANHRPSELSVDLVRETTAHVPRIARPTMQPLFLLNACVQSGAVIGVVLITPGQVVGQVDASWYVVISASWHEESFGPSPQHALYNPEGGSQDECAGFSAPLASVDHIVASITEVLRDCMDRDGDDHSRNEPNRLPLLLLILIPKGEMHVDTGQDLEGPRVVPCVIEEPDLHATQYL